VLVQDKQLDVFCQFRCDRAGEMAEWVTVLSKHKKEREDDSGEDEEMVDSIPLHEVEHAEIVGANFFKDLKKDKKSGGNLDNKQSQGTINLTQRSPIRSSSAHEELLMHTNGLVNGFSKEATWNFSLQNGQHAFCVRTVPNGFNGGSVFIFKCASERENESWIRKIGDHSRAAHKEHLLRHRVSLVQHAGRKFMQSGPVQMFLSTAILASFVTIIVETQLQPAKEDTASAVFMILDTVYLVLFTIELAMNMFCYWFKPFWQDGWFRFDFMVVFLSLVQVALESLVTSQMPGIKQLRVLRTFRIIKAFGRFKELKKIIRAICASVGPVGHATVITGKFSTETYTSNWMA